MSLPSALRAAADQAQNDPLPPHNLAELRGRWQSFVAEVQDALPGAHLAEGGEIFHLGPLSPGCQACIDGRWDCLFVTSRCNLACPFCCNPLHIPPDASGSAYGQTPDEIALAYNALDLGGISFSGGEPLLEPERLFEWLAFFKSRFPRVYTWIYTNGLLAAPTLVEQLAALGLDEIRFNTAASGYHHPQVLEHMRAAARLIPALTVEIPSLPDQADLLFSSLQAWCEAGVRFLNLHELMHEPGTLSEVLPGERYLAQLPDGHATQISAGSRPLTLEVMKIVQRLGLPLAVNDCSLQRKLRQLRGRRRTLARLALGPHEQLVEDTFYTTCCAVCGEEVRFFHPARLAEIRPQLPGWSFYRLARLAPLALGEPLRWVSFEQI